MSYFSFLLYVLSHKKYVVIPIIVGVICFGIAWILPPVFKSEIRLQVDTSQSSGAMGMFSSMMRGSKGGSASGLNSSLSSLLSNSADLTSMDLYMEVLTGRDVMLETIHKFRLDTLYKKKHDELLLKRFMKDVKIEEEDGVISCSFEDKNRYMARDLVRFMVHRANEKYLELEKQGLSYSVEYLQKSQHDLLDSVKNIGEELVEFYRENNLVDLESQMKLTMSALAAYEGQINNFKLTEQNEGDNANAADLRKRRNILEQKFKELRGTYSEDYKPSDKTLYVNSNWAVSKMLYQKQRQAELEMYMSMLELTSTQVMMTEADRLKSQPAIRILQDAYLPDWKCRPKRGIWAVAGFGVSMVIVLLYLLLKGMASGEIENSIGLKEKLEQIKLALRK